MKTLLLTPVLLALGATARVSYEGAKAMRIAVGEDVVAVAQLIADLSLPTWKGAPQGIPKPNSRVDLVVPANKVQEFESRAKKEGLSVDTMHEDLGAAIDEEGRMSIYQGIFLLARR
jgi:hypothetical protein